MTGLLASVTSAAEAETALAAGADIIDLKDPEAGALGALPSAVIREAVEQVAGRRTVSATAGDLPMNPAVVTGSVARIAALGVDIVKIGLFPGGDRDACLDALAEQAAGGTRLVAVLFADRSPDLDLVDGLAARGFAGIMLDTAGKEGGGLRRHLDEATLARFVDRAAALGLMSGLAGSLRIEDVAPLLRLGPDYLGFRGALCEAGRRSALVPARVRAVRAAMDERPPVTSPPVTSPPVTSPSRRAPRRPRPGRSAPPIP